MKLLSRDEIIAGIRNAVERGSTVEQAIQSFINAGYNPNEIEDAASAFNTGGISIITSDQSAQNRERKSNIDFSISSQGMQPKESKSQDSESDSSSGYSPVSAPQSQQPSQRPIQMQKPVAMNSSNSMYQNLPPKKKSRIGLIIFLVILLLIIIGGIVAAIIYKDQLAEFLSSTFSSSTTVS